MIDLSLYLAFITAVTVLMLIPGPNVALIVANSVAHGARYGLLTVAGTSTAMILQLALVALGMTQVLGMLGAWFEVLRWIGVAYLIALGIRAWRAPAVDLTRTRPDRRSPRAMFTRALLVSMTNPKTLLFYGAFFPQFVSAEHASRRRWSCLRRPLWRSRCWWTGAGRWRLRGLVICSQRAAACAIASPAGC